MQTSPDIGPYSEGKPKRNQWSLRTTMGYVAGICAILSLPGGLFLFAIFASWLTVIVVVFGVAMLMQFPLLFLVKLWLDQQAEYEAVGPHDTNPMNTIPLGSFSAGNDSHLTDNSHH
jgi:hypothetical protein